MFEAMKQPVPPGNVLTTYTIFNGVFYLLTGLTFLLWPQCLELAGHPPITPEVAGPIRGVGLSVIYIASFYLWTARSRFVPTLLGSVVNRLVLGPAVILPLVYLGLMHPMLGIPFCLMDVVFGIGMYIAWRITVAQGAVAHV